MGRLRVLIGVALTTLCLTACTEAPAGREVRFFAPDEYPTRLSEWGVVHLQDGRLQLGQGVEAYDLNTPLFTDYAQKLRGIYLPPGTAVEYREETAFEFPVGTIIVKTFFYPRGADPGLVRTHYEWAPGQTSLDLGEVDVLETRLLIRQADGWDALPYVWRGDDAVLTLAGSLSRLVLEHTDGRREPLPYIVPTRNECAACHATNHTTGELQPLGPRARHLNRGYLNGNGNQLVTMAEAGRLVGLPELSDVPANARLGSTDPVAAQARAYLDVNCGHCHNARGAADTSGLLLDAPTSSTRAMGFCKPPIAAGQGTGGRSYSIVPGDPDDSIIVFRMATSDPGARMPELGRSLVHSEGVALISAWIAGLEGVCIRGDGSALTGD